MSSIVPILCEFSDDLFIRNGNRTYLEWIVLLIVHLLVRLQHHLLLEPDILSATIAAGSRPRDHLSMTLLVQQGTATGSGLTSRQGIDFNISLTDKTL